MRPEAAAPTNAPYGLVGGETVERICPKLPLDTSEVGLAKFGWLSRLKAFAPTPNRSRSPSLNVFVTERSVSKYIGPRNWLRTSLGNGPVPLNIWNWPALTQSSFGLPQAGCVG